MQSQTGDSASEAENKPPTSAPASEAEDVAPARPQEETEETWEEKEDKLAPEKGKAAGQKYGYKEGELCLGAVLCWQSAPLDPAVGKVWVAWSHCPKFHILLPSCPQAWHGVGNRVPSTRVLEGGRELVASGFLSMQDCAHGVPGWGSSVVVYIPPHWSLCGLRPATAQDGGYGTGHIRVSLLPSTAEQWKPLNPEEKKRYDREFLLGFQFIFASMQKPEGLPQITDVVLDKVGAALEIGELWVVVRWESGSSLCLVKAGQGLTFVLRVLLQHLQ